MFFSKDHWQRILDALDRDAFGTAAVVEIELYLAAQGVFPPEFPKSSNRFWITIKCLAKTGFSFARL